MKRAALYAGVALAALLPAAPAQAGIETLIATGIASFLPAIGAISLTAGAGFGIASGTFAIAQGLTAALLLGGGLAINSLLSPKLPNFGGAGGGGTIDPSAARNTFESAEAPELRAVGRVRLGGLKAFGNTVDANRYRFTVHCKGEVDAFEEFYFQGREIVVDTNDDGAVSSFPWIAPGGSSWAYVKTKNGDGAETAWTDLVADFPEIWTGDHRARGLAQTLAKFISPGLTNEKFLSLYQGGVPDVEVVIRAEKGVYDPRILSSAWTQNGILNAVHILLSYPEFSLSDIDLDFIGDEADRADAVIATLGGNVARARCSGVWSSETPRGDIMRKVLESIGAWIVPRADGDKIGIQLIDDAQTAEITIAAKHIVEIDWQSGPQGVERPDICRLKYYSPERNYEMAEVDLTGIAWARIDDEVAAYGEKYFDVELPFCPNAGQAQRRARQMFALARSDSGIIRTNMAGLAVWGARMVAFEFPDELGTILTMIGAPRVLDDKGLVEIPFVVWPTLSAWDTAVDEAAAPEQIPDLAFGNPLTTPYQPSAVAVVTYPVGGTVTRVGYAIPVDAVAVEAVYRIYTGANPGSWLAMTEYLAPGGAAHAYVAVDEAGKTADFRIRTFDGAENGSSWSPLLNTVVPAIDNSAPGAPGMTLTLQNIAGATATVLIVVTAPVNLNVAYLTFVGEDAPTNNAIKPGEQVQWPATFFAGSYVFQSSARSSNGTAGAAAQARVEFDVDDGGSLLGKYLGGGEIGLLWRAPNDEFVVSMRFTGPSAPGDQAVSPGDTGTWTASGLGAGTHVFSALGFDNSGVAVGTAASVSFTI